MFDTSCYSFTLAATPQFQFSLSHDKGRGHESRALTQFRSFPGYFELPKLAFWAFQWLKPYYPDLLNTITIRLFNHLYRAGNFTLTS